MLRRLLQNQLAHRSAAGEEQVVKFFLQKPFGLLPPALDDLHIGGREDAAQQTGQEPGGGGGIGAGLHHGGVACGQGIGQGPQGQQHRVIPGAQDQGDTVGGGAAEGPGQKLMYGGPGPLIPGQPLQVPQQPAQLAEDHADLAHIALSPGFSQILAQSGGQLGLMLRHGLLQPLQGGGPVANVQGHAGVEKTALPGGDGGNGSLIHI